jgi:hypothetical protein
MSCTQSAVHLIERTAACLCDAFSASVIALAGALRNQQEPTQAIGATVDALWRQLQLRQAAWGVASNPLDLLQLMALARGLPGHVAVDASALPPATLFSPAAGRVVLNILLLAADSLSQGGQITLAGAADDLFVRIDGPAAAWPIGMILCLANEAEARSALTDERSLQMALTALFASAAGIRLSALLPPTTHPEPAILRLGR